MNSKYLALIGRVNQTLNDLEQVIKRIELLFNKYQISLDDGYLDAVALNLHSYYSGIERIFKDIALNVDKSLPSSPEWHQDLLLQMRSEIPNIRPAVISEKSRYFLDDFRGFRHVIRNVYTFNLNPERVNKLTDTIPECFILLKNDLKSFLSFIESI